MANKPQKKLDIFRIVTTSFCVLLAVIVIAFAINIANDIKGAAGLIDNSALLVGRLWLCHVKLLQNIM